MNSLKYIIDSYENVYHIPMIYIFECVSKKMLYTFWVNYKLTVVDMIEHLHKHQFLLCGLLGLRWCPVSSLHIDLLYYTVNISTHVK